MMADIRARWDPAAFLRRSWSSYTPRAGEALSFPQMLWLLAGMLLAFAPHTGHLPWWVNVTTVVLFAWRVFVAYSGTPLPRPALLLLLAVGDSAGVYFTYGTIFGRDAGVTMLVLLLSLKLMEVRARRDVYVVAFLAYFVAFSNFLYSQTIPTAGLMVLTVLMITSVLVGFNAQARPIRDNLKTAAWMLAQAAPVMLLLFFLFPRVQGPLWGLPQDAFAGVTGLSDSMSPGTISQLSQSDAISFRTKFRGATPPRGQLYWRGPVFTDFDGITWRPGLIRQRTETRIETSGAPIDYEVTLEPHNRNWLFVLEMPTRLPPNARVTAEYQVISLPLVRSRIRYEVRSFPQYRAMDGSERGDLRAALALPAGFNPRARETAEDWRRSEREDGAIVQRAVNFFRNGGYEYTLLPPRLGTNTVDEFLFDTKQGFCEHFAASFVFLMRAAGVPSRIVTGYQGGDINPVDGYMEVRQADAHAWAEVWLGERGWVRVDPTAVVVPLRVEAGISAMQSSVLPLLMRADNDWLRAFRNNWSALANQWNQWVLGYNPDRQRDVLAWFGVQQPSWQTMAMLLFWSIAGVLLAIALWLLRTIRRDDPVQRLWLRFCAKLARVGLVRALAEGPLDYAARVVARLPQREAAVRAVASLYVELRYGPRRDPAALARLRGLVREFRP